MVNPFKMQMETKGRLFVECLPAHSPDKNPIEKLWKNPKKEGRDGKKDTVINPDSAVWVDG